MNRFLFLLVAMFAITAGSSQTILSPFGASWKYLDNGSNQRTAWRATSFNDAAWKTGSAPLGYGIGGEGTVVSYGTSTTKKYITTYFRRVVSISNPSSFANFTLNLRRDDGAVVYINGTERFRSNMPAGTISNTTVASGEAADNGSNNYAVTLPSNNFVNGNNTIAVEIHQVSKSGPDIRFDLQLVGNTTTNTPPVSRAGADQTITLPVSTVTLDGSTSSDADGSIVSFAWGKLSGPAAGTITSPASATTSVTGLVQGVYTFRLTVTDNLGATATDDVVITVNAAANIAPIANAGADQTIMLPQSTVTLDGSASSDPEGQPLTFTWNKLSGPAGGTLTSPSAAVTTVTGLTQGVYTFRLTVTDNLGAMATDDVVITVNAAANIAPTANAGADQTITLPVSTVALDGSTSSDADGSIVSFAWSKLSGPAAGTITSPGAATTSVTGLVQGVYTFRLTVTDNLGATATDDVVITVNAATNIAPTANAGADQIITLPVSTATLNGSASSDVDGSIVSFAWSKLSGPAAGTITSPASATTSVTGLVQGVYTFRLTVTDNLGATATDDVMITVNAAANIAPTANAGADQNITLPANSITLNGSASADADGSITSYAWSKVAGPPGETFGNAAAVSTTVKDLAVGSYVFRLTVTDNLGATGTDDIAVTVNDGGFVTYTVMDFGSSWKYLDNGSNQGTAWTAQSFNDNGWKTGKGEFGYGDSRQATLINYGPDANNKYITTYFRKVVSINNPSAYGGFTLNTRRDDGVVIYVNSVEVYRNNMPTGTVSSSTLASSAASDDGTGTQTTTIAASAFVQGNNTIAVEVHQNAGNSSDLTFDMQLKANQAGSVNITRGPYLQMGNQSAVTLRWRTDVPTNSKIDVGTSHGVYTLSATNATSTTEHEVRITGLAPDTKYYYRFGSTTQVMQAGTDNFFTTAPPATTNRKIKVAVFGDCGRNDNGYQTNTLNAYRNFVGSSPAELMLLLGDNAYTNGTDAEYTTGFFNVYSGNILRNHVLFPAPGNHDYYSATQSSRSHTYYNVFTMPTAGESGGLPSGTEAWYSYDWGNIHFLSLDSYGTESPNNTRLYDTTGPQVTWIKNDLAANTKKWTVVYWHHPPYTMGSHNSDTETELINIRQNFIRILERYGVDMILCGHSHDYERSYLLRGHFGNEASFSLGDHAVSSSSGKYDGTANSCAYQVDGGQVNHGTVYVVSGSAGASGGTQAGYPHNAMPYSFNVGGMFYFEVEDNRLDAKFLRHDGVVADQFTIMKDAGQDVTVVSQAGEPVTLTASWIGNYQWSTGATTRSITVSPPASTLYTCTDGLNCLTDQFNVQVTNAAPIVTRLGNTNTQAGKKDQAWSLYPTPVKRGTAVTIRGTSGATMHIEVMNEQGKGMVRATARGNYALSTARFTPGVYFVRVISEGQQSVKKLVVE